MLNQFWLFSFQTKPVLLRELKPCPFSGDSRALGLLPVFSSQVRRLGLPFLASQGKLFQLSQALSLTHPCGSQSVWSSVSACLLLSPGFVFRTFSPSPSPMVRLGVWLVFLGSGPAELQLCLLFVLTESASDTPWSEFPAIGDSNCVLSGLGGRQQMHEHQGFSALEYRRKLQDYFCVQ